MGTALNRQRELRVWCTASALRSSAEAASSVLSSSPESWIARVGRANSSTRHYEASKDTSCFPFERGQKGPAHWRFQIEGSPPSPDPHLLRLGDCRCVEAATLDERTKWFSRQPAGCHRGCFLKGVKDLQSVQINES